MVPSLKTQPSVVRSTRIIRLAIAILFIAALFGATMNNETLYVVFGNFWQKFLSQIGSPSPQQASATLGSHTAIDQITNTPRNTPAVLIYGFLYVGICLTILMLLLPVTAQRKAVFTFYGVSILVFVGLVVAGYLGGTVLLQLSSQLIHFIVSPLPVVVLVPLLRWYYR